MTAPPQDRRCVRCDADLTVPPHVKLCWHGVPGAYLTGEKGDLCDPCHEKWKKEREAAKPGCTMDVLGLGPCSYVRGHEGPCSPPSEKPDHWGNGDGVWKKGDGVW